MRVLIGPSAPTIVLRVSPDGRTAAAIHLLGNGGPLNTLAVWDLHSGEAEPSRIAEGGYSGLAFFDQGQWIAALATEGVQILRTMDLYQIAHRAGYQGSISAEPDSPFVRASSTAGVLDPIFLDGTTGSRVLLDGSSDRLQAQLGTMDRSPLGGMLAVVYVNQNNPRAGLVIGLFDLAKRKMVEKFSTRRRQIQALRFASDGRRLAVLTSTQVLVWDVVTKKRLAMLEAKSRKETLFTLCVEFTRDSRRILVGTDDGVQVFDTTTWTAIDRYDFGLGPILSLAVTPDGLCGLAGGNGGRIAVWDLD